MIHAACDEFVCLSVCLLSSQCLVSKAGAGGATVGVPLGNDPLLPEAKTLSCVFAEVCSVLLFPCLNSSVAHFVGTATTLRYLLQVLAATAISEPASNPAIIF